MKSKAYRDTEAAVISAVLKLAVLAGVVYIAGQPLLDAYKETRHRNQSGAAFNAAVKHHGELKDCQSTYRQWYE